MMQLFGMPPLLMEAIGQSRELLWRKVNLDRGKVEVFLLQILWWPNNPILKNSDNPEGFDSYLIDDACLVVRDGKYWFYYKGRKLEESPHYTKMGVAIADNPEGPYVKYEGNPIIPGNHAVLVWPQGNGVAAMIDGTGPPELIRSILYSEDGFYFKKMYKIQGSSAAGAYRSDHFLGSDDAKRISWGVEIESENGSLPFLQRFDLNWTK